MRWVFHETVQNCVSWIICNCMPLVSHHNYEHTFCSILNPNNYFYIYVAMAFVVTFLLKVLERKIVGIWEDCNIWFWWLPCQDMFVSLSHSPKLFMLYGICIPGWVMKLLKVYMWFISMYVIALQLELRRFWLINVDEDSIVFIMGEN